MSKSTFRAAAATIVSGIIAAGVLAPRTADAEPRHGIAMHGAPALPPDFAHFPYANPAAPKGGTLRLGVRGSYDSLNPLTYKGSQAPGVRGYVYESLMARNRDEPFALYGLIAEKVETPDDRSWVAFTLNPAARFSDGTPITVDDIVYSHALLRDHGKPNHRRFYSKVARVETPDPRIVKFHFEDGTDREMALILGLMPVVPKHQVTAETIGKTTLTPPIGSGPYRITRVDAGRSIEYTRNPDYWGRDLPAMRGRYNFDTIRYEFFRDVNTLREAFSKGVYDVRGEGDPAVWALGYDFPAVTRGDVIKRTFKVGSPSGMAALAFNTRRDVFADTRVRQALVQMFDFEWLNQTLYHGLYVRTQSYFDRSSLSSHGRPASAEEKALLGAYADKLPPAIMDGTHAFPKSDGRGRNRDNLRAGLALLKAAGYSLKDGRMANDATGKQLSFEILIVSQPQQKMLSGFVNTLRRIGIDARIRQVDGTEYTRRRQAFDFDMTPFTWSASLSPGNEQNFRWSSGAADENGSFNVAGAKDPAIDAMINALLAARERPQFEAAVRAYDRTLLAGNYIIPLYHLPAQWVAHWSYLGFPQYTSLYGYQLDAWWDTRAARN